MLAVLNLSSEVMDELVWLLLTTKETLSPSTDLSRQCEAASTPFLMSTLHEGCSCYLLQLRVSPLTCISGCRRCSCTRG